MSRQAWGLEMTLNSKIGLSLVLPMLVGLALIGWQIQHQLLDRFQRLEAAELQQQHERLEQAIEADLDALKRLTRDWGEFDDTYAYMRGDNPDYIDANIDFDGLLNLQLDALALVDAEHRLREGFRPDHQNEVMASLSPEVEAAISRATVLLAEASNGAGVIVAGDRVLALGLSEVLTTEGEGPANGYVVMARYLDGGAVERLASRIRSEVDFEPLEAARLSSAEEMQALNTLHYLQRPLGEDKIASFSLLRGLDGEPALLMRVLMRRDILRQGEDAIGTLLVGAALGYLSLVLAVFVALRWIAVRRIQRVGSELQRIADDADLERKQVSVHGRDEIAQLAVSINQLLQRLVEAFRERHRLSERQRKLNALLVQIATDESLAGGDAQTLCGVLQGPLNTEIGLDHWSLWLCDAEGHYQCLSESDQRFEDSAHHAMLAARLADRPAGVDPYPLTTTEQPLEQLAFGFQVDGRQGALVAACRHQTGAEHPEDIAFLSAATQLIERSLNNHYQHQREQRLRRESELDPLTQLANRSKFELELSTALRRLEGASCLAVLFIDLDRFKPINDEYGHAVGDAVLREVSVRLRAATREADLVGRLGGDEFVILLRSVRDQQALQRVAEKVLQALCRPMELGELPALSIGASIGAALAPLHGRDPKGLLDLADQAMYRAKRSESMHFALADLPPRDPP
ncbi:sensor domain-containing diguanylate cyclase [Pseudomarimonas arenosa]|uniref:Diguanylate cyclase n=1 Tax=Pseudomarimonas arenosa TaxID=2774145 RepID=A0AAW3ZI25_9GAMM|nr:diguanylate cyclase [Pseudomarimonas arenosa]MBD8525065.1 diguanylate cyclase [Pseudomarimonas arenosa]